MSINVKQIICFIWLVLLISPSFSISAESYSYAPHSVATEDGFVSPKINPAALGFGNNVGLGFSGTYINESSGDISGSYLDTFSFSVGIPNFGYFLERKDGVYFHSIGTGFGISLNNYFGFGLSWREKSWKTPDYILSFLSRPADFVSIGANARFLHSDKPVYRFGVGFRPLFFSSYLGNRITGAIDLTFQGRDVSNPMFSVETELFDGFFARGSLNMEDNSAGVELAFTFPFVRIGSTAIFINGSKIQSAGGFVFISGKEFRSVAKKKNKRFINYQIGERVVEIKNPVKSSYFNVIQPGKDILQIIEEIERLEKDGSVYGIVMMNQNFRASFANYMEISQALKSFKESGKKVIFYYQEVSNLNYALAASVADEIYLQPQGYISLVGVAMASPYMKDFLDMLGIEVLNMRSHPYKSSFNMYSESGMTEEERAQLNLVIDSLYNSMCDMIESGRKDRLKRPIREIIDDGPCLVPERALEEGLIDGILYPDQLKDKLKNLYPGTKMCGYVFTEKIRYDWSKPSSSRIAIIYAIGPIHTGEGKEGSSIGSETLVRAIRKARNDPTVGGIIIRVSSGGGSAVASDVIAREIKLTVGGSDPKPVIISMGGVAASGGYYISSMATEIVAEPVTLTGSIGVVAVFPNISVLSKKLGINWETIKRGKHSDMGAIYRKMTEEEKEIIRDFLGSTYDKFVRVVAEGRSMDIDEVRNIAQGKLWTGEQARQGGLIDELGGLARSVELMKNILGLEEEPEIIRVRGEKPFSSFLKTGDIVTCVVENSLPDELEKLVELYQVYRLFENEIVLLIAPVCFLNYE